MPSFAAIVPNYNDSATLTQALDSLLAQTSPFDEIVVVDDGSSDNSRAIIADYAARHPTIRNLPNETNIGIVATLNRGMQLATSDFIITCSSNDWYSPEEVAHCRAALLDFPDAQMVCGNAASWDVAKNKAGPKLILNLPQRRRAYSPTDYVAENQRATIYFNGGAIAMRREHILAFGLMHADLEWHADLILYLLFAFSFPFAYVPEIFSTIRLERGRNYADGRFRWREQREVTAAMLRLFKTEFPEQGQRARASAMLPKYDLRTLALVLQPEHRWYLSALLVWRVAVHTLFYWTRRMIPRRVLMAIRSHFRV